ncbi:RHO1 GDP-GTP exchange protein 2, partial [Linderina pennispora]
MGPKSRSLLVPSTSTREHASLTKRHTTHTTNDIDSANGTSSPRVHGTGVSPSGTLRHQSQPVNPELVELLKGVKPVYPAMLSAVAKTFSEVMGQVLQTHTRNGLEYTQCFTGREAVDAICVIIQTNDRNLAVVVGRALAQQKLFQDVEYERRLRDDPNELFAFETD